MFNRFLFHLKRNSVKLFVVIMTLIVSAILVKSVLIDVIYVNQQYERNRIITNWGEKIKSGNLSVDYTMAQTLSDIAELGLNTVNVPVQIDIPSLSANAMHVNLESKKKAIRLIRKLRYMGINVLLEPYPYIQNGELYETELNPSDVNAWFENWKYTVMEPLISDIAKPYKIYALCIGSNFEQMEREYDLWSDLADFVRISYEGRITYKTNWWYTTKWDVPTNEHNKTYNDKLHHPVFAKVDFISVAAYFELTDKNVNTVENLVSALYSTQIFKRQQNVYEELADLSSQWQKPVFFGELGFPKRNKASAHPWNPLPSEIINEQEQANCFLAYKKVFEKATWNLGFSIFAIGKKDELKNYYPSEQSIAIVKDWYQ